MPENEYDHITPMSSPISFGLFSYYLNLEQFLLLIF